MILGRRIATQLPVVGQLTHYPVAASLGLSESGAIEQIENEFSRTVSDHGPHAGAKARFEFAGYRRD